MYEPKVGDILERVGTTPKRRAWRYAVVEVVGSEVIMVRSLEAGRLTHIQRDRLEVVKGQGYRLYGRRIGR